VAVISEETAPCGEDRGDRVPQIARVRIEREIKTLALSRVKRLFGYIYVKRPLSLRDKTQQRIKDAFGHVTKVERPNGHEPAWLKTSRTGRSNN
jgi:hypothetical protein